MPRIARGFIPPIDLDPQSRAPLFRQIERGLRNAILRGELPAGTRIPSTRAFARELQVSRTTVLLAFDQLLADGLLVATPGSGTFVADDIPELASTEEATDPGVRAARRVSGRGQSLIGTASLPTDINARARAFSMALGLTHDFPFDAWARSQAAARRALGREGARADAAGCVGLKAAGARFLHVSRGLACEPEQLVVVANIQEALYLLGILLLDQGDHFWHEDPGHPAHRSIFEALGGVPVAVGVDDRGFDTERGRALAPLARLAVLSPSGEFPLARATDQGRRKELLSWARENDAFIVEDDWDPASLLFGQLSPAMASRDPDGRVIYIAGFARVFSPVLRMALLVLPPFLVDPFLSVRRTQQLKGAVEGQPAVLDQLALADFLEQGSLEAMARSRAGGYRERHGVLLSELERNLGGAIEVEPADGVTYGVGLLPDGMDDRVVARRLADAGVDTLPVSAFYAGDDPTRGLVMGSAAFDPPAIQDGVERMARAWESL